MKLFRKLIIPISALIACLFLVACSNTKQADFQYFDEAGHDFRKSLYYQGDKMIREKFVNTSTYEAYRLEDADQVKDVIKSTQKYYDSLDYATYSVTFHDDYLVEVIEIDFSKIDFKEEINLPQVAAYFKNGQDYSSYQKYRTDLLRMSYKEVQNGKFQELPK